MRPIRFLLVDDSASFRNWTYSLLMSQPGYELVGEASNGIEAVQKAKELRPELVILDIGLPKLNGIEAARQIRSVSPAPEIVFLTADNCRETARVGLEAGAKGFVFKFDAASELQTAIETVLRGKEFVSRSIRQRRTNTTSAREKPDTASKRYECSGVWHPLDC